MITWKNVIDYYWLRLPHVCLRVFTNLGRSMLDEIIIDLMSKGAPISVSNTKSCIALYLWEKGQGQICECNIGSWPLRIFIYLNWHCENLQCVFAGASVGYANFLGHLAQRAIWAIAIIWRPSYVINFFKDLLIWNYWANWNQTMSQNPLVDHSKNLIRQVHLLSKMATTVGLSLT